MTALPEVEELREALRQCRNLPVLVLGDLMLDHYLLGEVGRISPEAPVPVVRVRSERHMAGGAGNVARNLAALGAKPFLLSAVGDDEAGRMLATILESGGVEAVLARESGRPTTIKTRIIAQNQQVARVDRESQAPLSEGGRGVIAQTLRRLVPNMAAVVVSDYAKGVIGPEIMRALFEAQAAGPKRPLVLVDPKPANRELYAGADLLTPNLGEAGEMSGVRGGSRTDILKAGLALFRQCRCRHLCITLGPEGIALFRSPSDVTHIPTAARRVYDVTGAGDSVMAALACGLASGRDVLVACMLANACAGIAVSQVGAVAVGRDELDEALRQTPPPRPEIWLGPKGMAGDRG
jgi:rfaE bifunctional protein kinase chain/domain